MATWEKEVALSTPLLGYNFVSVVYAGGNEPKFMHKK